MLRSRAGVFWCAALIACARAASFGQQQAAKDYPSKPIRLVVPFVAGGTMDFIGHALGQKIAPVRWSELPDVPTIDEAGVNGYAYVLWYGMWFPAGTPGEYVARIRAEVVKALEDPATKRTFAERGLISVASTPQEFGKTILEEIEFHRRLVARMGLTPQ